MSSHLQYQPPVASPPKPEAQQLSSSPYQLEPSARYSSSQPPNEAGYAAPLWTDQKEEYGGPLEIREKCVNDVLFLLLFILQFCSFIAVSGIVLVSWVTDSGLGGGIGGGNTGTVITLNQHTVFLLLFVTAAGLVLATMYLLLVHTFCKIIIQATLILSIGICAYYWITRYYSGAIIFTIIAVLSILAYFGFRRCISLATLFLQVTIDISKYHLSVYAVVFSALIIQVALAVWFSFITIATYAKYTPKNPSCSTGTRCSSGTVTGLIFFETFSFLWTSQVIGNVALSTLAGGPYGTWYYFARAQMDTMSTATRERRLRHEPDLSLAVEVCLACCAECFVGFIKSLVKYFNCYAYIEIALYGKPYIKAAKDTWKLFKDRGIDAIVNDALISMTLIWGAYIVRLLSSLLGFLYLRLTRPSYNNDGQYTAPVILFAFVIGLQCSLTLSSAIEAGVSTIFVGLGHDLQVLAEHAPALFEMIRDEYPQVVQGVQP